MALVVVNSTNSDADCEAAYDDNCTYDQGASSTGMAKAFQAACRALIRRYPQSAAADGTSLNRNLPVLQAELAAVGQWLQANDSNQNGGNVIIADTRQARW